MDTQKTEFYVVKYDKLSALISDFFDQPNYNIVHDNDWNNEETYSVYNVCDLGYEEDVINRWLSPDNDFIPHIETLLDALCYHGQIEEGNYLIEVNW